MAAARQNEMNVSATVVATTTFDAVSRFGAAIADDYSKSGSRRTPGSVRIHQRAAGFRFRVGVRHFAEHVADHVGSLVRLQLLLHAPQGHAHDIAVMQLAL